MYNIIIIKFNILNLLIQLDTVFKLGISYMHIICIGTLLFVDN